MPKKKTDAKIINLIEYKEGKAAIAEEIPKEYATEEEIAMLDVLEDEKEAIELVINAAVAEANRQAQNLMLKHRTTWEQIAKNHGIDKNAVIMLDDETRELTISKGASESR